MPRFTDFQPSVRPSADWSTAMTKVYRLQLLADARARRARNAADRARFDAMANKLAELYQALGATDADLLTPLV